MKVTFFVFFNEIKKIFIENKKKRIWLNKERLFVDRFYTACQPFLEYFMQKSVFFLSSYIVSTNDNYM